MHDKNVSKFTGSWYWADNIDGVQYFSVLVGERNDYLLFAIGGIFCSGNKMHDYDFDDEGNLIASVRTVMSKNAQITSKISEFSSDFYNNPANIAKYNYVSFELLNDTTMLFILDDNKAYWPDTAIMMRRDYKNHKFSLKEDCYLYK